MQGVIGEIDSIDIVVCNPPFFDEEEGRSPLGTMTKNELIIH